MPTTCCVLNCGSRGNRDLVNFYKIPGELHFAHRVDLNELSKTRRQKWIHAIRRADLTDIKLRYTRVCSKHFVSGKPSELKDEDSADWVPSLAMGYNTDAVACEKAHIATIRKERRKRMIKDITKDVGTHCDIQETPMNNEYEDLVDTESVTDSTVVSAVKSSHPQFHNKRKCNSISGNIRKPNRQAAQITSTVKEVKDLHKVVSTSTPCQSTATTVVEDECDIMGKQIAVQLRTLPEHMRVQANFEIQRILMDFRIKKLKYKTAVSSSTVTDDEISTDST